MTLPALTEAELAELQKACDALHDLLGRHSPTSEWHSRVDSLTSFIAGKVPTLLAMVRELKADAERYRWLRDKCPLRHYHGMIDHGESGYTHAWWGIEVDADKGMDLDAAIDQSILSATAAKETTDG